MRERGDVREAHRGTHALEGVCGPEVLVDRRAIVGHLLDADNGKVQLLEVLTRLREEHRQILGNIHQAAFR